MKQALILHSSRFPSVANGLGRVSDKALSLISGGSTNFISLFPRVAREETVFGFGDLQVWSEIKRLAVAKQPLITIAGPRRKSYWFNDASIEITETGRRVLAGERDFIEINGIDLWLGGVHLVDRDVWRWDEQRRSLIHFA